MCCCNLGKCFYWFLFRNNHFSTFVGLRWFIFLEIISPALENTLSQGTGNAGVLKKASARAVAIDAEKAQNVGGLHCVSLSNTRYFELGTKLQTTSSTSHVTSCRRSLGRHHISHGNRLWYTKYFLGYPTCTQKPSHGKSHHYWLVCTESLPQACLNQLLQALLTNLYAKMTTDVSGPKD